MKRAAMSLIIAFYFAATVLHLASGQFPVRPIFNANSYMGREGGTIVGNLVISGLSGEELTGSLVYCIEVFRGVTVTDRALATYGSDFIFQNEPEQNFTEVTFFPNRDASSSFTIILLNDGVSEGDEYFFLRFRFKRANGTFLGAFLYQDSTSTFEQECTIEDNETDGIVVNQMYY
jgi:hypothetical protein